MCFLKSSWGSLSCAVRKQKQKQKQKLNLTGFVPDQVVAKDGAHFSEGFLVEEDEEGVADICHASCVFPQPESQSRQLSRQDSSLSPCGTPTWSSTWSHSTPLPVSTGVTMGKLLDSGSPGLILNQALLCQLRFSMLKVLRAVPSAYLNE